MIAARRPTSSPRRGSCHEVPPGYGRNGGDLAVLEADCPGRRSPASDVFVCGLVSCAVSVIVCCDVAVARCSVNVVWLFHSVLCSVCPVCDLCSVCPVCVLCSVTAVFCDCECWGCGQCSVD